MVTAPLASARAYAQIKQDILDGALTGGTLVTEGELATTAGVSRTPVREALLRLEVEGLVRLYPKKGALIVPPSADDARDVLEARMVIEEWAAAAIWPRRRELFEGLEHELTQMRTTQASSDIATMVEHDRRFHEILVGGAGNAILTRTYQGLRDRQLTIITSQMRASHARIDAAVKGHAHLLDLLRTGTKAEFVRASREHVEAASDRLRAQR